MPKLKLPAVAAVATALASLLITPAAVAHPWIAPWAVGQVIGAAARLATLPLVIASAAVAAAEQPSPMAPPPQWTTYAPPPPLYPSGGYYGPPAYYGPPPVGYYGGPQRYYRPGVYRAPAPYPGGARMPESFGRYSTAGMRYSAPYGGQVFSRARGLAHRRW